MSVQVFGNIITMNKGQRADRREFETHNEALNTSTATGEGKKERGKKNLQKKLTLAFQ